ncbi:unnamed protein product [Mytilus edulis]|uniref:Uncharacterized protein n=1 Tax=Mytilus edulis TaxID=6550 RepID=A0A8S3TZA8_MYTED|nr:unnamed protein product [Mytilus edulis]
MSENSEQMEYVCNSQGNLRSLFITANDIKNCDGTVLWYDGVIRPIAIKGFINRFWHYTGLEAKKYKWDLYQDARQSLDVFLPIWQTTKGSSALTKRNEPLWQEFVTKKEVCIEDRKKIALNALAVVFLIQEYSLDLSTDEGRVLSQAILPEIEKEGSTIFPGEKPSECVKHNSYRPIWWGIADKDHYSFDLQEFKKKSIEESYLQDIMENLSPYFRMDYLLPRTLMSCLGLEQLPFASNFTGISPDIILASLCFYVKDEKYITRHDWKETVS